MIANILEGKEKSKCVIIEDTVNQSGKALLACFICILCRRVEKVHVICYERSPEYIQQYIPTQYTNRLVYHDASVDPLGRDGSDSLSVNSHLSSYLTDSAACSAYHSVAIVIDCLSLSLLERSGPLTCQTLASLRELKLQGAEVEQVVCLLHADLHDHHSLTLVEHLATSIIRTLPPTLDQFLMATQLLHKRMSGKVIKITEHFSIDEQYNLCDITELKSLSDTSSPADIPQPDPTANLTFNLTLSDKEKEARSHVKLPYTYDKGRQDETLDRSVGEGKIFYQPDEADDFDEDDPDDDLDI